MSDLRDLDRRVAEGIMGGTYRDSSRWERWDEPPSVRKVVQLDDNILYSNTGDWSPSTDIAAAWQVLEKLEFWISLSSRTGDGFRLVKTFQRKYRLDLMCPGGIKEGPEANTAPEAICRAALSIKENT